MRSLHFALMLLFAPLFSQSATALESLVNFVKQDLQVVRSAEHATQINVVPESKRLVLIIHGLHESPAFMKDFEEHYRKQKVSTISLRLPGHFEKDVHALNSVSYKDWVAAAETAFQLASQISNQVEILGFSTGGALGTYLALKHPQKVKKLYLIAPALALSNKVAFTALLGGWTNLDSYKFCSDEELARPGYICQFAQWTDEQVRVMRNARVLSSLSAGLQVVWLIDHIRFSFTPRNANIKQTYYSDLEDIYLSLNVPIVMVNTELDNVVHVHFMHEMMKKYKGDFKEILFSAKDGISHIALNKSSKRPLGDVYNSRFDEILKIIDN